MIALAREAIGLALVLVCCAAVAGEPIELTDGTFQIIESRAQSWPGDDLADLAGRALKEATAFAVARNMIPVTVTVQDFRAKKRGETSRVEYRFRMIPKDSPAAKRALSDR